MTASVVSSSASSSGSSGSSGSSAVSSAVASDVLAFSAGGRSLALPASAVERVLEVPATHRVPGTPAWFAGLAVLAGRLLPVTDLGAWLRALPVPSDDPDPVADPSESSAPPEVAERRLLELAEPFGPVGLLVDRVDGLRAPDRARDGAEAEPEMLDPGALTGSAGFVNLAPAGRRP